MEQSAIVSDFGKILGNCKTNGIIFYNLGYVRYGFAIISTDLSIFIPFPAHFPTATEETFVAALATSRTRTLLCFFEDQTMRR